MASWEGLSGPLPGTFLGSIAGKGTPPLPKQFGSMLSRLPQMIQGALKGILGGAGKVFGQQGQGMQKIQQLLEKLMQMLGGQQQQQPGPPHGQCGYGAPGVGEAGQAPASSGAAAPEASSGATSAASSGEASAASSGATSAASSGEASAASGGDPLMGAAMKTYDQMASTEQEISKLDPNSKDYQKKLMQLQQKMQKMNQMIQMLTQMMRMRHDMSMAVIRNIRT